MTDLLGRVASFFLAPDAGSSSRPLPVPPTAGVLAAERDLSALAGSVAARLRATEGTAMALVCLWRPERDLPPAPAPWARPAAAKLAARLAGRELEARARGHLCVVELPVDPEAAAADARRAYNAVHVPTVIAAARRAPALDALLADVDELVLGTAGSEPDEVEALARAGLQSLGPRLTTQPAPRGGARLAARLGLGQAAASGTVAELREAVQ